LAAFKISGCGTQAVVATFDDQELYHGASIMKKLAFILVATAFSTASFAQDTTTTIKKEEGLFGSKTTVEEKTEPNASSSTSVTTTGSVGCKTETKQKTDEFGDTTTKKTTEC
jgi:hypothetical protein